MFVIPNAITIAAIVAVWVVTTTPVHALPPAITIAAIHVLMPILAIIIAENIATTTVRTPAMLPATITGSHVLLPATTTAAITVIISIVAGHLFPGQQQAPVSLSSAPAAPIHTLFHLPEPARAVAAAQPLWL